MSGNKPNNNRDRALENLAVSVSGNPTIPAEVILPLLEAANNLSTQQINRVANGLNSTGTQLQLPPNNAAPNKAAAEKKAAENKAANNAKKEEESLKNMLLITAPIILIGIVMAVLAFTKPSLFKSGFRNMTETEINPVSVMTIVLLIILFVLLIKFK